jgi:MtrB/PioB family decaheme-associated outer membrane protein
MITRNALRAIALATTCLAPLAAFAQTPAPAAGNTWLTGDIEIGLMGVGGSNPDQAGRYNGLNTTGINAYTQFDLNGRAPWDSGGTRYYELEGDNLVYQTGNHLGSGVGNDNAWESSVNNSLINSGSLSFKAGDQGTWEIGGYYDAITYTGNVIDSLYSVNGGKALLNNNLAPWGGATAGAKGSVTAFTVPSLTATGAMLPFQTGTRRDIVGGDGKYMWGDWTISIAVRHEHKEGSLAESFDGAYGGTAFAMPIDYDTDRYDASAAYTTHQFQAFIQYTYSHFSDNNTFVNLPYPTSNTAAPFQRSAAYSTPPSNSAHYLTVELASDVIPRTRVNLNARVGLEMQDDTFAPNTADPNPTGAAGLPALNALLQGTSEDSLDARATVYQIKASATSHPFANTDARIYYGVDGRDVSLDQYKVNVGGTGGSSDSSLSGLAYVVPQDWLKQNAGAEVGYRIIPEYDTKVTAGYRLDIVDRSNAQAGHSSTSTGTIGLTSQIGSQINGALTFAYADRSGALNYLTPWENLAGGATSPAYSGAYYQAPMTSESVTARADYSTTRNLSADIFVQFKNENYTYTGINPIAPDNASSVPLGGTGEGVKQDFALSLGPDITYRPFKGVDLHLFYTYELLFFNNLGNGACATPTEAATAGCAGTAGYFQNKDTTSTHTVGVSGDWKVNDKLTLRADYTLSYGSVMFGEFNGVFVPSPTASYQNVVNYPDINSLMNSVNVTAIYELTPNIHLVGRLGYTAFHDNDWNDTANAIQGAGTSAISILTPGYSSPNYNEVLVMAGLKFSL